ncbi:MAG: acyltransferase [Bacillota bacterium]|nr:acyltransferase [Bacillota bacterium]
MRGVAILAVMLFHADAPFMKGGFIGVDIFFVLSGFLITALLIREYDRDNNVNFKHFYMRRVLRLAPALIFLLLVFSIFSVFLLEEAKARSNLIDSLIALFYASNWARALQIHPPDFLGHTWALSIEAQFYVVWPLTFWLLLRNVKSKENIFLIVLSLAFFSWFLRLYLAVNGSSIMRLYNGLDTRGDALLIGCALAVPMQSRLISVKIQYALSHILKYAAPLSAIALISIGCTLDWGSMHMYYWLLFVIEVLAALLILDVFISKNGVLKRILSQKLLVFVGSISYGLYLWHFPVYRLMQSYGLECMAVITIGSAVTFLVAWGSYCFIERSFLQLNNKFL